MRISNATVERMRRRGRLPRVMIGYASRIHRWHMESYIEGHRIGTHRPQTDGGDAA